MEGPNDHRRFDNDGFRAGGAVGIWILRELGVDYQPCSGPHLRKMARLGDARFETLKSKGKQKRCAHRVLED